MRSKLSNIAMVAAFVLVLAIAPMAIAAKGGGAAGGGGGGKGGAGGGGTTTGGGGLSLVLMDGATQPTHYGRITFNVSTSATATPEVGLRCYQGATWVYDSYVGYFPGYLFEQWFTLQSNYWADGIPATCDARLFSTDSRGRQNILSTMSFTVAP